MRRKITTILLSLFVPFVVGAQTTKDISFVYAAGKVSANQYQNAYFGLTVTPVGAEFTKGGFISSQGQRARLIAAEANSANWAEKYTIAILADALSANPLIHSPEQYVRSVRHAFEREDLETVEEESPVEISGLKFVHAIMKTRGDKPHYQGMNTAFLKGYILSLQVEAPSRERVAQIARTMVSIQFAPR